MVAKPHRREPESPITWLESELRDAKSRLHKVERELEQALKQVWSMEADIRRFSETLSVSGSATATLSALREEMRQVHGQLSKLHDRQSTLANRSEEVVRQRHAEGARDRQDIGTLAKQFDGLSRAISQYDGRIQGLEEAVRHAEEEVAGERLDSRGLERSLGELSTRSARTNEATLRIDQEVAHIISDMEKLRIEDAAVADRLTLLIEQMRRLDERVDKLEEIAPFPEEARELLKRANFEREQLAQRTAAIEKLSNDVAERLQEFLHGLARLDERTKTQGGELLSLATQLHELTEQTRTQLKRVFQTFLRQRRRQSETLTQEIKELSEGELHSWD